jgi:hypothetical protein
MDAESKQPFIDKSEALMKEYAKKLEAFKKDGSSASEEPAKKKAKKVAASGTNALCVTFVNP